MNVAKMMLIKLGHFFLTIVGILRRALCCFRRRRKMSDSGLPMTNNDLGCRYTLLEQKGNELQNWDSWQDGETLSVQVDAGQPPQRSNSNRFERTSLSEDRKSEEEVDEFFKDMAPTIRRTKKYVVRTNGQDDNVNFSQSSRLAVDIKATSTVFNQTAELGVLEDNVQMWEDVTESDEHWNPETAMREQKLAERERRLAEHQRRKQEKEQGRNLRSNSNPNRLS